MRLLKYSADLIPLLYVAALFIAQVCLFLFVHSWLWLCLGMLVLTPLMFITAAPYHHHQQHHPVFHSYLANRLLELMLSFQTGVTTNAWTLQHNLGHHQNYLDQEMDQARWRRRSGESMSILEYTVHNVLMGYIHVHRVGRQFPKVYKHYLLWRVIYYAIIVAGFMYAPLAFAIVFVIPSLIVFFFTVMITYDHHAHLSTENVYCASRNNINKWYNIMTCNLGYHTAHHIRPGLHWSKLPEFHKTIEDKIPKELLVNHIYTSKK